MSIRLASLREPRYLALLFGLWAPLLVQQLWYRLSPFATLQAFDTRVTYLPLARRFLEDAPALFADPAHLIVAPGSFIYLALFGADNDFAVQANLVLSGLILLLAFDSLRRTAGFAAGAAVAWLIAVAPLLPEVLVPALSEPPQLFFVSLWLWCSAILVGTPEKRWPVVLGGIALLCSILVRATYVYWILAALGACALLIGKGSPTVRRSARGLLVLHLIAGAGAFAYIAYNKVEFDLPMVATGSGAALYFGSNPAVAGYEPPYYGLLHDHTLVVDDFPHLSLEGERRLGKVAKAVLADLPAPALAELLTQKAGATLFFSQATLSRHFFNERAWRVLLLSLACFGLWSHRQRLFAWLLACVVAYQLAILLLVMHSARYSVGALELPLTLMAGLGLGALWHAPRRLPSLAGLAGVALVGMALGYLHQRYSRPLMPDLSHVHHQRVARADPGALRFEGIEGNPFSAQGGRVTAKDAAIVWPGIGFKVLGGFPVVRFDARDFSPSCDYLQLDYFRPDGEMRSSRLRLNHMSPPQTLSMGTLRVDALEPMGGTMKVRFRCPKGTLLKVDNLEIHAVTNAQYYREKAGLPPR
ncbi:hypothetical protein [Pseudomonas sp. RIT-PI-AD]|uniref:hypothetical protein n=1 Tax=Pseudomonas sp. RIT-PI-AD TaxID=3035294 RepID=UPI0021DAE229|nr:hypothetical protein [Pseudomonas sp. RIT-PI-AD]